MVKEFKLNIFENLELNPELNLKLNLKLKFSNLIETQQEIQPNLNTQLIILKSKESFKSATRCLEGFAELASK